MSRTFWLPYAGMQRLRWGVGALLVQLLALGANLLWVKEAWVAIGLAMTTAGSASFWLWMTPAGSLLLHLRQGRELRLPRQRAGFVARTALLLLVNLLPASALIGWRAADADWAVFMSLLLLAILLGQLLFLVTPFRLLLAAAVLPPLVVALVYLLAPLLPWQLPRIEWSNGLRITAALMLVSAASAMLLALGRRFVMRPEPGQGMPSCVLDFGGASAAGGAYGPEHGVRALPDLLLPRQHVRSGDTVQRRVAQLLGAPYAPGSTRRLLAILSVIGLVVVLIGVAARPGMHLALFVAQTWLAVCITFTVSTRLAMLFRKHAPELSELALLPGQGDALQRRQCAVRLLLWRPLLAQAALTLAVVGPAWAVGWLRSWSDTAPLLCLSLLAAALMTWETARYVDHGEGWFGKPWVGSTVYAIILTPWLAALAWLEFSQARTSSIMAGAQTALGLALIGLLAFSAWRAYAAQQRSIQRPHALAAAADRVATAHPA